MWKCDLMVGRVDSKTQSPKIFLVHHSCYMKTVKSSFVCISQFYHIVLKSGFALIEIKAW